MMMMKRLSALGLSVLALVLSAAAANAHTFRFRAPAGTRSVAVAGSFNGWSAAATPLSDADADGVWTADVVLRQGAHQYKFVVNGSDWTVDPENPKKAADGLGGENSLVEVTAADATAAAPRGAPAAAAPAAAAPASGGKVRCPACGHEFAPGGEATARGAVPAPAAAAPTPGGHVFRFRSPGARSVSVAGSFNGWNMTANPMTDPDGDGVFEATVRLAPGSHEYKFVVNGADWKPDPENPKKTTDGNDNSIVEVGAGAAVAPAAATPRGAPAAAAAGGHTFRLRSPGARSVVVAGSFNGWSQTANPMTDPDGDGVFEATVRLAAGSHTYKYVVNGSDWKIDPENPKKAADGLGGENSLVEVP